MMLLAVRSRSASAITSAWFLASVCACTRLPCEAAIPYICFPTEDVPTKQMPLISGCVRNCSDSCLVQVTMLRTPSGSPASCHSSAQRIAVSGVLEAALTTIVLPVAMQMGTIHPIGIIPGKLKGEIPANTPSGSLYVTVS